MSPEEAEAKLDKFFVDNFKNTVLVSARQMAEFAEKNQIPYTMPYLSEMRSRFKFSAISAQYRKPHHFQAFAIPKYGLVHLDLAVFHPQHRRQNDGFGAFLVAKEAISQQLAVLPVKNGTTKSWEAAVVALAEGKLNAIRVLVTDRDSAVKSEEFRKSVEKRFGITWTWLKVFAAALSCFFFCT
jgi:hypothetical protein